MYDIVIHWLISSILIVYFHAFPRKACFRRLLLAVKPKWRTHLNTSPPNPDVLLHVQAIQAEPEKFLSPQIGLLFFIAESNAEFERVCFLRYAHMKLPWVPWEHNSHEQCRTMTIFAGFSKQSFDLQDASGVLSLRGRQFQPLPIAK